jgi:hypothetical protein
MLRSKRTADYRKSIENAVSLKILDYYISKARENGDILKMAFWDNLIFNDAFRIEWVRAAHSFEDRDPANWECWWDFEYISMSKNFDIAWLEYFPDEVWDWSEFINSKYFTIKWVEKYPDGPWGWDNFAWHNNFDISWVERFPDKDWDWFQISSSKNMKSHWIIATDYPWVWQNVVQNSAFSIEWVANMEDEKKHWIAELYKQHTDPTSPALPVYPWCTEPLLIDNVNRGQLRGPAHCSSARSCDSGTSRWLPPDKFKEYYEQRWREYMAVYKIQQWWKYITISPNYAIGRRFIERSYDNLFIN